MAVEYELYDCSILILQSICAYNHSTTNSTVTLLLPFYSTLILPTILLLILLIPLPILQPALTLFIQGLAFLHGVYHTKKPAISHAMIQAHDTHQQLVIRLVSLSCNPYLCKSLCCQHLHHTE